VIQRRLSIHLYFRIVRLAVLKMSQRQAAGIVLDLPQIEKRRSNTRPPLPFPHGGRRGPAARRG
jgi:hypothetical protein